MAAETTDKVKFDLAGTLYEFPDVLDLDMDEWIVVYEYSGLVLEDFAPLENPEAEAERVHKLRHPGFMKAMTHIGYQRAHPKKTKATIKDLIGNVKMLPLLESMAGDEPESDDPPTSVSEPQRSSERSPGDSNVSLSLASPPSSETQDVPLVPTGTSG